MINNSFPLLAPNPVLPFGSQDNETSWTINPTQLRVVTLAARGNSLETIAEETRLSVASCRQYLNVGLTRMGIPRVRNPDKLDQAEQALKKAGLSDFVT